MSLQMLFLTARLSRSEGVRKKFRRMGYKNLYGRQEWNEREKDRDVDIQWTLLPLTTCTTFGTPSLRQFSLSFDPAEASCSQRGTMFARTGVFLAMAYSCRQTFSSNISHSSRQTCQKRKIVKHHCFCLIDKSDFHI